MPKFHYGMIDLGLPDVSRSAPIGTHQEVGFQGLSCRVSLRLVFAAQELVLGRSVATESLEGNVKGACHHAEP